MSPTQQIAQTPPCPGESNIRPPAPRRSALKQPILWAATLVSLTGLCTRTAAPQTPASPLFSAHTIFLDVVPAHPGGKPIPPENLADVRRRATSALAHWPEIHLVPNPASADLVFRVGVDEHYRYGFYTSQWAPAIFLRVLDPRSGALLFCGWHQAGLLHSSTKRQIDDLRRRIQRRDPTLAGPPGPCEAAGQMPPHPHPNHTLARPGRYTGPTPA